MLKNLLIKNFILLDDKTINFSNGFNVLCGETGAGKSIIIKALDCVLGAKITKEMILDKIAPCLIEATFEQNGKEIVVSRETLSTSKFRLDGALVTADEIKELRTSLIDIHSQHQTYSYISSKSHLGLLDCYITKKNPEYAELLEQYKNTYSEYKEVERKLKNLKEHFEENNREIEFLEFQLKELDDAAVGDNEEEELKREGDILSNIATLKEGSYSLYYALYGDNQSIVEALSKIKYELSNLSELDKNLIDTKDSIFDAFENLKEAANNLNSYSSNLELNPARLDEVNERISLIQKLKRKYGADLGAEREKIAQKLKDLCGDDNNIEELEKNYEILADSINFLADKLSEYRKKYAFELSELTQDKLRKLELKDAIFKIDIKENDLIETGRNSVEFLISTNKNVDIAPLSHVASGGEISRVILALKTIFALVDNVAVVFDEIDTGISGITSTSVAQSLTELAKETQVICITHQAIIAAKADYFLWIEKTPQGIEINTLDSEKRLDALAQMASGVVDETTRDFAKTLVK